VGLTLRRGAGGCGHLILPGCRLGPVHRGRCDRHLLMSTSSARVVPPPSGGCLTAPTPGTSKTVPLSNRCLTPAGARTRYVADRARV